jgi:lipopolysaccharide/colanic/teichoic acid biosynthesis glycosyltransferase
VKRLFDIITSITGLLALSPLLLVAAAWIRLDSPGPVIYLQERVGKGGTLFRLLKFRTMRVGAERERAITVGKRDPRITRSGYWLRRFKLDELPQLVNVVRGEMSLVGPRPELKVFVDRYTPEQLRVLSVSPGITDRASIRFRNENGLLEGKPDPIRYYQEVILPEKLRMNLEYVANRSFFGDIGIVMSTLLSVFQKNRT